MPKHILLVEDSVTMQKVVQIAFAREDYQIVSTTSADEALARAKEHRPDVVVADTSLPGKSGYDLAAAMRAEAGTKDVPILLLTGNFNPYDEQRGQKAGIDAHIVKPFDTQSLIDKVNNLVKGRAGAAAGAPAAAAAAAPAAKPAPAPTPAPAAKPAAPVAAPGPAVAAAPKPVAAPPAAAPIEPQRSTLVGMPHSQPAPTPMPPIARPAPVATPAPVAAPTSARAATSQPGLAASQTPATEGSRRPASQMPQMPRPSLIPRAPVPAPVLAALERIAARGPEYEAIAKLSAEAIQQIVWEVVPELAEIIIRAEVDRLAKERKA